MLVTLGHSLGVAPHRSGFEHPSCCICHRSAPLCVDLLRYVTARPKPRVMPTESTSDRGLRPSGDITAGVRFTRAYHTRHLPPLGFLTSSTASTSSQLACPVSYRRHLWDSKNTSGARCTSARSRRSTRRSLASAHRSSEPADSLRCRRSRPTCLPQPLTHQAASSIPSYVGQSLTSTIRKRTQKGGGLSNTRHTLPHPDKEPTADGRHLNSPVQRRTGTRLPTSTFRSCYHRIACYVKH